VGERGVAWGWFIGGTALAVFALTSAFGAIICLFSGNLAGAAFGIGWALVGYWFARGMLERARPTSRA